MTNSSVVQDSAIFFWPFRILSWILGLVDNVVVLLRFVNGPKAPKFFKQGWDFEKMEKAFEAQDSLLQELSQPDGEYLSVKLDADDILWGDAQSNGGVSMRSASFVSPLARLLPTESKNCHFLLVKPATTQKTSTNTYIVMLPATGEMGKRERLTMAKQLAIDKGWSSIIVTAPYYAKRKPSGQTRFFLPTVGDALVQSQAIVQEAASLIRYVLRKDDDDDDGTNTNIPASPSNKVVVTGFSWGSAMSSLSATTALLAGVDGKRLACVAYVGCASPEIFCNGVIENGVDWSALLTTSDGAKKSAMIQGVDCSSLETPHIAQKAMRDILAQVQLRTFVSALIEKDPSNQLATVKMQCMYDDRIIPRVFSKEYLSQMQRLAEELNFQLRWMPGGHVFGAMLRPILKKRDIVEAVYKMEKDL
ncbi:MAG: hypothetical protein SGILL_000772 [Bacillariaceae sp.]